MKFHFELIAVIKEDYLLAEVHQFKSPPDHKINMKHEEWTYMQKMSTLATFCPTAIVPVEVRRGDDKGRVQFWGEAREKDVARCGRRLWLEALFGSGPIINTPGSKHRWRFLFFPPGSLEHFAVEVSYCVSMQDQYRRLFT